MWQVSQGLTVTLLKKEKKIISKHTRHFDVIVIEDKPQRKELVYVEGVSEHKVDS
jgi:hypothetical protein